MPFINGRYYINPAFGRAVEAAREAEDARGMEQEKQRQDDGEDEVSTGRADGNERGPIHRVEIESTEVVTPQSGRAQKGFAARIHRAPASGDTRGGYSCGDGWDEQAQAPGPETHVFSDHRDLVSFLRDQFAKDMQRHS